MNSKPQTDELDKIFTDLNILYQNYSEFNPEQRVKDLFETCFSRAMLTNSPIKNVAGNIATFSMVLSTYLSENDLSYKEFIDTLNLPSDKANLLLEFEYDFSIIRPVGGPSPLSNKPINKSLIVMYSRAVFAICTAIGSVGVFVQPFVDIQTNIQEKEQKEIDQQIEIEKLLQNERALEQKDRELDLIEESLNLKNREKIPPNNSIDTI